MITQSLAGDWELRQVGGDDWLPARVPGDVHTALLAAGRIPDPFDGENERQVQWVAGQDWEYRLEWPLADDLLAEGRVTLVCQGLDTLAELALNGRLLGRTDNVFRTYRFEVKPLLGEGTNTLSIVLRSPTAYVKARQRARRLGGMFQPGVAHLRKVQSHFGWDWGPVLPTSGIWGDIALEGRSTARLDDVHLRQHHEDGRVTLSAAARCEVWGEGALTVELALTAPGGATARASAPVVDGAAALALPVENPQLWWPNGLGGQPLYQVHVALRAGERTLDERVYQVGLRTVELRREPDRWGESFDFVVNGVPIFAKGANWIPPDAFVARVTPEHLEHLVGSAAAANMNMLRVWGGGYYERDAFYDLCDRYGLLVWQDCAFACAAYPLDDPDYVANVRAEVSDNVRRLRHRASLALWCGNNEVESLWPLFRAGRGLTRACERFFYHELPTWLQAEDPERAYWPSSPSPGRFRARVARDAQGDTHNWTVWHGLRAFRHYRRSHTRFASEFGMQALPALATIAAFAGPGPQRLRSRVLAHHQRSPGGNDKLIYYLAARFRLPRAWDDLVYLTQVNQAEAVRIGVEHWRRHRPRCTGALYWQLDDCWPATSWASIDYYGRWKALHYAARRFFAPLALSLEDTGSRVAVYVANDLPQPWQGEVRWSLETLEGAVVAAGREPVATAPLGATHVRTFNWMAELRARRARDLAFVAELWQGEARLAGQVALFAPEKALRLPGPGLAAQVVLRDGVLHVDVAARALARFVELALDGAEVVFSDNYFDLPAGRERRITCPLPPGWSLEQAREALRVRSLAGVRPGGSRLADLILTGFMFPDVVYRRADVPVFDPLSAPISEIRLAANQGLTAQRTTSQDPVLIAEVLACLRDPGSLAVAVEPHEIYHIDLLSPQAPGVSYMLYVAAASDGQVYLAERATPEAWLAAGGILSQWVRGALEHK